ncbi:MAG TPA: hypothetical protein VK638_05600, partial [Edaphobacter sp.]|nr:hypothetical protein [Edaphobacter sp.]
MPVRWTEKLQIVGADLRSGEAASQFLEGLRRKAKWLDKRINAEFQESDPLEQTRVAKIYRGSQISP